METHTRPAPRGQRVPPREGPQQPARVNLGAATRRLRTRFTRFLNGMLTWQFGPHREGLAYYLVVEHDRQVAVLEVQWFG
jgi:hypothetical protein